MYIVSYLQQLARHNGIQTDFEVLRMLSLRHFLHWYYAFPWDKIVSSVLRSDTVHDRDCCAGAYGVALYTMRARKVKQRMRLTHHYWFCNARIRLWLLIGNCGLPGVRCIGCHECATTHYTVSVLECDASGWQVSIIHHGVAYHSAWPQQYSFWKWMKIRFQTFLSA